MYGKKERKKEKKEKPRGMAYLLYIKVPWVASAEVRHQIAILCLFLASNLVMCT